MERRIAKTVDGAVTAYIYDASAEMGLATDDILLEFDATDSALPILTRRWLHSDSVDEPIAFETYVATSGVGSGAAREVYADRQGSVISVVDPVTATVEAAYEYDAFGALTQVAGTLQQPYGYTGREYDAESGLYYFRARTYDPATGMFLQSDPIGFAGSGNNLFAYVQNNPYMLVDPSGLFGTVNEAISGDISKNIAAATPYLFAGALYALAAGMWDYELPTLFDRDGTKIHSAPGTEIRTEVNDLPGSGNCEPDELEKLEREKDVLENRTSGLRCNSADSFRTLSSIRAALIELKAKREEIMNRCFQGGDAGHQEYVDNTQIRIEKCNSAMGFYGN